MVRTLRPATHPNCRLATPCDLTNRCNTESDCTGTLATAERKVTLEWVTRRSATWGLGLGPIARRSVARMHSLFLKAPSRRPLRFLAVPARAPTCGFKVVRLRRAPAARSPAFGSHVHHLGCPFGAATTHCRCSHRNADVMRSSLNETVTGRGQDRFPAPHASPCSCVPRRVIACGMRTSRREIRAGALAVVCCQCALWKAPLEGIGWRYPGKPRPLVPLITRSGYATLRATRADDVSSSMSCADPTLTRHPAAGRHLGVSVTLGVRNRFHPRRARWTDGTT
jgi:hypothetical protein